MRTENMIEITGCSLTDVVQAAYDLSRPQGLGFLHYTPEPLSGEEALQYVDDTSPCPVCLDYVKGRACKLTVHKDDGRLFIREPWYDHTDAQLAELLKRIGADV